MTFRWRRGVYGEGKTWNRDGGKATQNGAGQGEGDHAGVEVGRQCCRENDEDIARDGNQVKYLLQNGPCPAVARNLQVFESLKQRKNKA